MPTDEDINLARHVRGYVDKNQWLIADVEQMKEMSDASLLRMLSKLNSRSKHVCLIYQRKQNQYDELLDSVVSLRVATGSSEVGDICLFYSDSTGNYS